MKYYFAPMEGITGYCFRRVHRQHFPGLDAYYTPFVAANQTMSFSGREKKDIDPANNADIPTVPQILTNNVEAFVWALREMAERGYEEADLNLGCPSATVVSRHRGAGMLEDPARLDRFLDGAFGRLDALSGSLGIRIGISVKTRIGLADPAELPALMDVFNRYPLTKLIVHPRVREEFYNGSVHEDAFAYALERAQCPVVYNGDIRTAAAAERIAVKFPEIDGIMAGRGLLIDPALFCPDRHDSMTIRAFHNDLLEAYREDLQDDRLVLAKMKELIFWLGQGFADGERYVTRMCHAKNLPDYRMYAEKLFREGTLKRQQEK